MANSDYSTRGLTLSFCPRALTEVALEHLDTTVQIVNYTSPSTADIRVGSAAFIGDEIVKVGGYANGQKIDIAYTYRVTTSNTTGNGVHEVEIDLPPAQANFLEGETYDVSPSDPSYEFDFTIEVTAQSVNLENSSTRRLTNGLDYSLDSSWTLTILRNVYTDLGPLRVRAQYKIVNVVNTDTPVVVSIDGQNSGTTYTLNLNGGSLQAFTYIRYTLPFGGGNVNLVSGTDYSRSGNVITFLNDFRALSQRKYMQITRGCCDTIPQPHAIGTEVWFFDDFLARDNAEYAPTETISVKPLPRTAAGGPVPLASSPPEEITFNWRFARPYPPGLMKINTADWFDGFTLASGGVEELAFTWAHRNRVTQMDTLVDYTASSITPEASTTYRAKVYDATDTLIATHDALTGTSWSYTLAQMNTDFSPSGPGTTVGYLVFCSVRDGLESWQQYSIDFEFENIVTATTDVAFEWDILEPPILPSVNLSPATLVYPGSPPPASWSLTLNPNGTVVLKDWDDVTRATSNWLTSADEDIATFAGMFEVTSISVTGGSSSSHPSLPYSMSTPITVTAEGVDSYTANITITPSSSHPRFGSGEFGLFTLTLTIAL